MWAKAPNHGNKYGIIRIHRKTLQRQPGRVCPFPRGKPSTGEQMAYKRLDSIGRKILQTTAGIEKIMLYYKNTYLMHVLTCEILTVSEWGECFNDLMDKGLLVEVKLKEFGDIVEEE